MKKQRYNVREMPDTVINLINSLTKIESQNQGRLLNAGYIISKAVAKLGGYEQCPDCGGLIEPAILVAPPKNIPENKKLWTSIKKQHVTSCSWVKLAMAGKINVGVEGVTEKEVSEQVKLINPIVNVIEQHTDVPREEIVEKVLEIAEPIKVTVPKTNLIPNTKIIKARVEDAPPPEDEEKVVWEKVNGVMVKKITKVGTMDESEKDDFSKDEIQGWGSTMSQGVKVPDGFQGTKNPSVEDKTIRGGKSAQGMTTGKETNNDLIMHEHPIGQERPAQLGKARVEEFKKEDVGKGLMDIPFDT